MKRLILSLLLLCVFILPGNVNGQTLGPYTLYDRLVSATHPNGCTDIYVTHWPTDSIWVNFSDGQVATGTFGLTWIDQPGDDLLLETGFHESNYSVRLMLQGGGFSASHTVVMADWTYNMNVNWKYLFTSCGVGSITGRQEYYLPLDFSGDFGIGPADVVTGVEITFQTTAGAPDFAGAYIIVPPVSLPAPTIHFDAQVVNDALVSLDWQTEADFSYHAFSVERSADGEAWESITQVAGAEAPVHSYRYLDRQPLPGTAFYRLKLLGTDGKYNYSDVREVTLSLEGSPVLYPVPASSEIHLARIEAPFRYSLYDLRGAEIRSLSVSNSNTIDVQGLEPGMYLIRIERNSRTFNLRWVKE